MAHRNVGPIQELWAEELVLRRRIKQRPVYEQILRKVAIVSEILAMQTQTISFTHAEVYRDMKAPPRQNSVKETFPIFAPLCLHI